MDHIYRAHPLRRSNSNRRDKSWSTAHTCCAALESLASTELPPNTRYVNDSSTSARFMGQSPTILPWIGYSGFLAFGTNPICIKH